MHPVSEHAVHGSAVCRRYANSLLERCTMPPAGSHIDCAVSGGPDSVALMILAVHAGCEVTAIHVDHGLREGSGREAGVVASIASRFGAGFEAAQVDITNGANLEARARDARMKALPAGVSTGHTMDDQAETVLMSLLRGSGLDGVSAMKPGVRHPILNLRRAETIQLCKMLGVETVDDPTNTDNRFLRNRVRHQLIPLCCEIASRDVVPLLARHALLAREESDFLDDLAKDIDPCDVNALNGAGKVIARRAIREWLRSGEYRYPPDLAGVERVLSVAAGECEGTDVVPGIHVSRSRGMLTKTRYE
ncbi:MAG: tRNA lysidine(34) synthetase TilS [Actinobacteria bacterium]|nr:tRNA lysidine(34) synthetase TilS [Actinomycetota bacterium]